MHKSQIYIESRQLISFKTLILIVDKKLTANLKNNLPKNAVKMNESIFCVKCCQVGMRCGCHGS